MASTPTTLGKAFDLAAAQLILAREVRAYVNAGGRVDGRRAVAMMTEVTGVRLDDGRWQTRHVYDACEAAQVMLVRERTEPFGNGVATAVAEAAAIVDAFPTQSRRSETQIDFQQFSTPLPLAILAASALQLTPHDLVLEPSAGTGLLAAAAARTGSSLMLNELEPGRRALLQGLFPSVRVSAHDAALIHALMAGGPRPTACVMNPPYARSAGATRDRHAATRHIASALQLLKPGGRLAVVAPAQLSPGEALGEDLAYLRERGHLILDLLLPTQVFRKHGTSVVVRLLVFDRASPDGETVRATADTLAEAAGVVSGLPPRRAMPSVGSPVVSPRRSSGSKVIAASRPIASSNLIAASPAAGSKPVGSIRPLGAPVPAPSSTPPIATISYQLRDAPTPEVADGLYAPYAVRRIAIPAAAAHPTPLVESVAMAAVLPPIPSYAPVLPGSLVHEAKLSAEQLETVIYAGDAFAKMLPGHHVLDPQTKSPQAADPGQFGAFQYRRGFFLGDGTGCGKGRQVAAIILDRWLQGTRRALWISMSDKLLEDARRDWEAVGGVGADIVPLSRFRLGEPVSLGDGILFTTYATFRQAARGDKCSRLDQIVQWLGGDACPFDGVIAFDEAHAMANALPGKKEVMGAQREAKGTAQGLAGLALQHRLPNARVLYVSATGATQVRNLGYANRLGLWGNAQAPFGTREDFVAAMEQGGVAAMELVARDLKAQGLYIARALSFAGVEYEICEHELTPEQVQTYDAYCEAFEIIHNNIQAALRAVGIIDDLEERADGQAKGAALSAFESTKQRFFNALLTGMKTPTVIERIRDDLDAGNAAVVQIVSTAEAMLNRRLSELSPEERAWLDIDMTPREGVITYLGYSFPTTMMTLVGREDGSVVAVPVTDEGGRAVECPDAVRMRDELVERLCALPAVPSALDQLIHAFGTDAVAEVTGRSKRLVITPSGQQQLENRPASSNTVEAHRFMDDDKRVLVFSQAGGTGRSYHADLGARNRRRRIHTLLEAGWRADVAIQGLGRSHRTNQASAPLFRPVTTNVKAERRFTSTIARRLDTLGALTRGQRQTGGQGLFRPEDNLESHYATEALTQWYGRLADGEIRAIGIDDFERRTGLSLRDKDGTLKEELPPIQRWLNRLLALPIALQNAIFAEYEDMIAARVLAAQQANRYDEGVANILADRIEVEGSETVRVDEEAGSATELVSLRIGYRQRFADLDALVARTGGEPVFMVNERSGNAAIRFRAPSDYQRGRTVERWCLERPRGRDYLTADLLADGHWQACDDTVFRAAWEAEVERHREDYHTDRITMLTGLILPAWKHIQSQGIQVRRAKVADGRVLLGAVLYRDEVQKLRAGLGLKPKLPTPADAWEMVMNRGAEVPLGRNVVLKRARAFQVPRLELAGFPSADLSGLKALGLTSEIIQFRTRLFVPDNDRTQAIIAALFERYPV